MKPKLANLVADPVSSPVVARSGHSLFGCPQGSAKAPLPTMPSWNWPFAPSSLEARA